MNERKDQPVAPLNRMFMLTCAAQLRPLLRPAARHDVSDYVQSIQIDSKAKAFLTWARDILSAHKDVTNKSRNRLTESIIQADELKIFRRPNRAYRVRRLF